MFSFQNPAAFLVLLLIPLLYILRHLKFFKRNTFKVVLSDWEGKAFEWKGKFRKFLSYLSKAMLLAGFVLGVISLADPVISKQEKVYTNIGSDIIFVIDTSPSMAAKEVIYAQFPSSSLAFGTAKATTIMPIAPTAGTMIRATDPAGMKAKVESSTMKTMIPIAPAFCAKVMPPNRW